MTETTIERTCENCNQEKRTTVHEYEEFIYYCEDCLKDAGRLAMDETSPKRGFKIIAWFVVAALVVGFLICRFLF